jgi:hypothetical protein
MKLFRTIAWLFAVLIGLPCAAQTTTLWEIGKYDRSVREFSADPVAHVSFQIGKSDWHSSWPRVQRSGSSYEIHFPVTQAPRGVFTLKISTLIYFPRVPALQIEINGHKGRYYLHPKPVYDGDTRDAAVASIEIPATYIRQGDNSLILSIVESRVADTDRTPVTETIAYDYISLSNDPAAGFDRARILADVVPTIFYRQDKGRLTEVVDAYLRFNEAHPSAKATLDFAGEHYDLQIPATEDFGEQSLELAIPEWQGKISGRLVLETSHRRTFPVSLTAAKKWTVFVVPHTHVDIGYTDYQGKVAENQAHVLEEAADLIEQHPDFRFATDGSWNVQQFLDTRSGKTRADVLDLMKNGKIGVPAQYFNLLTGYASLETLYRSFYYSKSLSRTYGIPFDYANITDVPSYTGSYPSVLASVGIKYWAAAVNGDRAPLLAGEQWNERSPFWWQGPDGQKVLFWCSQGYAQIGSVFGGEPDDESIREALPMFMAQYEGTAYTPDAVLMYGAQAENTDLHQQMATFAPEWNKDYAYPKLQYATFNDFFKYVDTKYGSTFATYKGDMGAYWEDGIASDAYYAAEDRENQSLGLSANMVSAVAHVLDPDVHAPKSELDAAWNHILLFAEHTWGAGGSVGEPDSEESVKQLAVKDNYATAAHFELNDVTERALSQIAKNIHAPSGTLVVFNTLSWRRDALVETDLPPNAQHGTGAGLEIVDLSNNQVVPMELVSRQNGVRHVRFVATDIPAVGYKCFELRKIPTSLAGSGDVDTSAVIENQYYRITVDPQTGSLRSIFDKQLNRELVDQRSPYRFGQYLYVTGGNPKHNDLTQMIHPYKTLPVAQLTVHPATGGAYLGTSRTPWGYAIKLRSTDINTPEINLEILLPNDKKEIQFRYTVQKTYTNEKEGVYFAFPAAVESPDFTYASQQGSVNPAHDILKGGDVEWFSVQKWMAVSNPQLAVGIVPVDASLATFGDINRGRWPVQFTPKSATIFSYAMNNYWHTNYRAGQGGTFNFQFVITSAPQLDPVALERLGSEEMDHPVLDWVTNQDKVGNPDEPLPAAGASFLNIDAKNVELVTWKQAEDSKGTIMRLQETAGQTAQAHLTFAHLNVRAAHVCDSVEDNVRPLDVSNNEIHLTLHPYEVVTIRLTP